MMMDISVQNRQNLVTFSIWICSLFSGYRCKKDFKLFKTQVKLLTRKYCCSVRIRDVEILYPVQYLKKNYLQKWNKSKFLSPSATTSAPVELTIKHALTISEKQRKCLQSLSLSLSLSLSESGGPISMTFFREEISRKKEVVNILR